MVGEASESSSRKIFACGSSKQRFVNANPQECVTAARKSSVMKAGSRRKGGGGGEGGSRKDAGRSQEGGKDE